MENKKTLIVGAGPVGIRTALERAEAGEEVTLVEKFPSLGAERIPRNRLIKPEEAFDCPDLQKVKDHPNIKILPYSEI